MQQKFAKRDGGTIDRSQDILRLLEFYKRYREKHKVDELREDEMKMRESGIFSGNLGEYVAKTVFDFLLFLFCDFVCGDLLNILCNYVILFDIF